jgi:hypothetical protein
MVIGEHGSKIALPEETGGLQQVRVLKQGDAALSFYRAAYEPENSAE